MNFGMPVGKGKIARVTVAIGGNILQETRIIGFGEEDAVVDTVLALIKNNKGRTG